VTASRRRQLLTQEKNDSYQKNREYVRNQTNAEQLDEVMIKTNENIESIARELKELTNRSIETEQNRIREIDDDFVELLTKIADEIILILKHFQKKIIK
jgi:hypothetical protein